MTIRRTNIGRSDGPTLSFPPFTRAVKWIIGINVVLFFAVALLELLPPTRAVALLIPRLLALTPSLLVHGWVWQLLTYSFVNPSLLGLIFGMLIIWLLGAMLETTFGTRWLVRYYVLCALGGAACSTALAYSRLVPGAPDVAISGVAGVYFGLLIAFGVLFADMEFILFPLPIFMKAKYLAGATLVVSLLIAVTGPAGLLGLGQLGGLIAGFVYVKFFHRGRSSARAPVGRGLSDRGFEARPPSAGGPIAQLKNAYYRWKRRRAAKKFEVYMREHDREVKFDDSGNYVPPSEGPKKGNGSDGKGGWVN